jgi:hypothetical protein
VIVLFLLASTMIVRLPFVLHGAGMMTSDDGISALMGKHISEGRSPPIDFYGQQYMGSFPSHVYALFFRAFGYSIFILKLATLFAFLGFIVLIFLFFADLFAPGPAAALTAFFILPIGHIVPVSLDNSSAFGFVLLGEAAILWGTRRAAVRNETRLLPLLGFLMGLAFWTNQASTPVIAAAGLYLLGKFRRRWKALLKLAAFAALGALPLVCREILNGFQIVNFLAGGEKGGIFQEKLVETAKLFLSLFSSEGRFPFWPIGLLVLAGAIALSLKAVRSKGRDPVSLIVLYSAFFVILYFSSRFSDRLLIRYLYPAYVVLPALLAGGFLVLPLKPKLRIALISVMTAGLFVWGNAGEAGRYFQAVRKGEGIFRQVVTAMIRSGRRYWSGSYWVAYQLTAVAGEKVIIDSYTMNRLPSYRLAYINDQNVENFVFVGDENSTDFACSYNLDRLLQAFAIPAQRDAGPYWSLFSSIPVPFSPAVLWEEPPARVSRLRVREAREENGFLRLVFDSSGGEAAADFRITAEVPGYSVSSTSLSPSAASAAVNLPVPEEGEARIEYSLEYLGFPVRSSEGEFTWRPEGLREPRKQGVVFLSGFSDPMRIGERDVRICAKTAALEATVGPGRSGKLRLTLDSPFQFADPTWHGRYEQTVRVRVEGRPPIEQPLADGLNTVDIDLGEEPSRPRTVRVDLDFRYQYRFDLVTYYLTAAFLEKAEILD